MTSRTVPNNVEFAFFKGINTAAVNGILSTEVTGGLPEGTYKLSTINSAANHQPVLVAVAQHGSLDDVVCESWRLHRQRVRLLMTGHGQILP